MSMKELDTLNNVIETLKDGEAGFRVACEDIESADLRSLFSDYASQRAQFAVQLQTLARSHGEPNPETSGSTAGALHRGWINLKAAIATRNAHAILAECERGEDSAVETYEKAMAEPELSPEVRTVLSSQYSDVKAAHDRIRDLRDSTAE